MYSCQMFTFIVLVLFCVTVYCDSYRNRWCPGCSRNNKNECKEVPNQDLEEILGSAYNPRYMSIDEPPPSIESLNGKRNSGSGDMDFYVDSEFYEDINDKPAWDVKNHVAMLDSPFGGGRRRNRYKRSADTYRQEWQCRSKITWIDLGPDYFPRYLRSVECLSKTCWYKMYSCVPRSFTVKILRRKRDKCEMAETGNKVGSAGLPKELRELWVWEERAVNFCCDCTFVKRTEKKFIDITA